LLPLVIIEGVAIGFRDFKEIHLKKQGQKQTGPEMPAIPEGGWGWGVGKIWVYLA